MKTTPSEKVQVLSSTIRITNLALRAIIGFNEWEREKKQDIIINLSLSFDSSRAVRSDNIADTIDYKRLKRTILELVENSSFNLLETLTHEVLRTILATEGVSSATVRIDKPHALRYADSVSVEMSGQASG